MIITLIGFSLLLISLLLFIISKKKIIIIPFFIGLIISVASTVLILYSYVGIGPKAYELKAERERLATAYLEECHPEIIEEIYEWNSECYTYKYWNNNPWTSWFLNDEIAKVYVPIELQSY